MSTLGVSLGARRGRPPWVSPRRSSGIDPLGGIDRRLRCKPSTSTSEFTSGPLTEACVATTGNNCCLREQTPPKVKNPEGNPGGPLGAPLETTPGNPLGKPLGGSEETSGGTSEETSGRSPGGPLEEPLGGIRRPTAGPLRTQQRLVRRRRRVEACIVLPITLLAQTGSNSSTTGGTQNQRTQGQQKHSSQHR